MRVCPHLFQVGLLSSCSCVSVPIFFIRAYFIRVCAYILHTHNLACPCLYSSYVPTYVPTPIILIRTSRSAAACVSQVFSAVSFASSSCVYSHLIHANLFFMRAHSHCFHVYLFPPMYLLPSSQCVPIPICLHVRLSPSFSWESIPMYVSTPTSSMRLYSRLLHVRVSISPCVSQFVCIHFNVYVCILTCCTVPMPIFVKRNYSHILHEYPFPYSSSARLDISFSHMTSAFWCILTLHSRLYTYQPNPQKFISFISN